MRVLFCILLLMPGVANALDDNAFVIIYEPQHAPYSGTQGDIDERYCMNNTEHHNGLYFTDQQTGELTMLLGGTRFCQIRVKGEAERLTQPQDAAQRPLLNTSLEVYEYSEVALSPDKRYLAITSLVIDYAHPPDKVDDHMSAVEKFRKKLRLGHYKILIIDLQESTRSHLVVHEVFNSYQWSQKNGGRGDSISEFDEYLTDDFGGDVNRNPLLSEFKINPLSPDPEDWFFESFQWGERVKLKLKFSEDGAVLYFRVAHYDYVGNEQTRRLFGFGSYTEKYAADTAEYQGVHLTFAAQLYDLPSASHSLVRAIMPEEPYREVNNLGGEQELKTFIFTSDFRYKIESTILITEEQETSWLEDLGEWFASLDRNYYKQHTFVHSLWVNEYRLVDSKPSGREDQAPGRRSLFRANAFDKAFKPLIAIEDGRLIVRTSWAHVQVFDLDNVVTARRDQDGYLVLAPTFGESAYFDTADLDLEVHGLTREEILEDGLAWADSDNKLEGYVSNVRIKGNTLLVLRTYRIANVVRGQVGFVYNMRENSYRFMLYPTVWRRETTLSDWSTISSWQRAREYIYNDKEPDQNSLFFSDPRFIARGLEMSPERVEFSTDGRRFYFLEWRRMAYPENGLHRDIQVSADMRSRHLQDYVGNTFPLTRQEEFDQMRWPLLARVPLELPGETYIQRLSKQSDAGRSSARFHMGLPVDGYVPYNPSMKPIRAITRFLLVPTTFKLFSQPEPRPSNIARNLNSKGPGR